MVEPVVAVGMVVNEVVVAPKSGAGSWAKPLMGACDMPHPPRSVTWCDCRKVGLHAKPKRGSKSLYCGGVKYRELPPIPAKAHGATFTDPIVSPSCSVSGVFRANDCVRSGRNSPW